MAVSPGETLLTPGGGRWTLNLGAGRPVRIRLRGRDVAARPELVTDAAEIERLIDVTARENPRAASLIPIPRRPHGRLAPDALDEALRHGFCIVAGSSGMTDEPGERTEIARDSGPGTSEPPPAPRATCPGIHQPPGGGKHKHSA